MDRREVLKVGAALAVAAPFLDAADWKPSLFNAHQNETVISLTELIIPATDTPGAKGALVSRYIDLLLHDGAESERDRFLRGLAWLDEESNRQYKSIFVKLPPVKQSALLQSLDSGSGEGNEFFRMAKSMTARIYYQTEPGFKELNKLGVTKSWACTHDGHA